MKGKVITKTLVVGEKTKEMMVDYFEDLKNLMTKETILVSVCAVNSETGVRQPLRTVKQVINKVNPNTLLHSDITQALGKIPINFNDFEINF